MTPAPKTLTLQDDRFILEKFIHLQVAGLPAVSVWTKRCGLEQNSWGKHMLICLNLDLNIFRKWLSLVLCPPLNLLSFIFLLVLPPLTFATSFCSPPPTYRSFSLFYLSSLITLLLPYFIPSCLSSFSTCSPTLSSFLHLSCQSCGDVYWL